ncbi:MAG: tail tape measure protein [Sphingomonadaceae bacterium]
MNDSFDQVSVAVRADIDAFQQDMSAMRQVLEGTLGAGAQAAGRGIEASLAQAARRGKLEFEDLAKVAGRALGEIAGAAITAGLGGGGGGIPALVLRLAAGAPGRATGGAVAPGRAYVVGENGPELFVPTTSGRVEAGSARASPTINLTVNVSGGQPSDPSYMARTGGQVARAVHRALSRIEV